MTSLAKRHNPEDHSLPLLPMQYPYKDIRILMSWCAAVAERTGETKDEIVRELPLKDRPDAHLTIFQVPFPRAFDAHSLINRIYDSVCFNFMSYKVSFTTD